MRSLILDKLKTHPQPEVSLKTLISACDATSTPRYKELLQTLNALTEEAQIVLNDNHTYALLERSRFRKGKLDLKGQGFGFIMTDDPSEDDIYIPEGQTLDAMHHDVCLVKLRAKAQGSRKEGRITRILKRHKTHVVGRFIPTKQGFFLEPEDTHIRYPIRLKQVPKSLKANDLIYARITNFGYRQTIEAVLERVLGSEGDPNNAVMAKLFSFGLDPVFPPAVLEEADKIALKRDDTPRTDWTDRPVFTIDGEDAKDFDDALDVTVHENGELTLWVHIADVSYYVTKDSLLDKEAFQRATSVYVPGQVIPMLPEVLSNEVCSLNPHQERYAMTCELRLNAQGDILKTHLYASRIVSKQRFTYTRVNALLEGEAPTPEEAPFLAPLNTLAKLARILHTQRMSQGSLDFDQPELKLILSETGQPIDLKQITRGIAERLIEECMLLANQAVAKALFNKNIPMLHRVHEHPSEAKLETLLTVARTLGYTVKEKKHITPKALQTLLASWQDSPEGPGLSMLLLRSMQKAVYSEQKLGHYGLAFSDYTHFTSPIRRYPDLVIHRLIRTVFIEKETVQENENTMAVIARHTSERERNAMDCERSVQSMKLAQWMEPSVGKTYQGIITSVTPFGCYVTLDNGVEGLLHRTEFTEDLYYDEALMQLRGPQTTVRLGQRLSVVLSRVNIKEGHIDLTLGANHESHR